MCRSAGGGSDPGAAQPTVPSLWCPQSDVLACRASCSAVCSLAAILSHVFQNASPCHLACSAAGPRGRMARCAGMQCSDCDHFVRGFFSLFTNCARGLAGGHHSFSNAGHAGPSRSSVAEAADACCREPRLFSLSVRVSSCILPVCGSIATIEVE